MCNAVKQQENNFTRRKHQKINCNQHQCQSILIRLLLAGLMFEVLGLTCEMPGLRTGDTQMNLITD